MKSHKIILTGLLFIGLVGLHSGCGNSNGETTDKNDEVIIVPVEIASVISGEIAAHFNGTATLEAEQETGVVSKVGGVVKELMVEEGDFIKTGQILARLDDEKIEVQVEMALASLQKLENQFNRNKELFDKNLISAEEYQSAKYELDVQKASYDLAALDLAYTAIRSPIDGVVAQRLIKVGNMVLPNSETFKVTDLDPLLAILHVPEKQIIKLSVGQKANIRADALTDKFFPGYVKRISPVVDPSTGTVKVTVEVRETDGQLKPGMFTRVDIIYDIRTNTVLLPKDAIISEDRESLVFVIRDSVAYQQKIELGYVNTSHAEILSGVKVGDIVVTTGKASLKDSTRVEAISLTNNPENTHK